MSMISESPSSIEDSIRFTGGVVVEYGNEQTWGHHDHQDEVLFGDDGGVLGKRESVLIATGKLTGLTRSGAITVDGISREIVDIQQRADGRTTEIMLRRARSG